jgi:SAM-dependent methyltransferase
MTEAERVLATNRAGWNHVAPMFHGGTALPEYGPLAPTEDDLRLLDAEPDLRALELGCGSGHSLRYLAQRGARELWGIDLSRTDCLRGRDAPPVWASGSAHRVSNGSRSGSPVGSL